MRDIIRFALDKMGEAAESTMANRQAKVVSSDADGTVVSYRGAEITLPSEEIYDAGTNITVRYTDGALSIESESAYR